MTPEIVKKYQCSGCVNGDDCYKKYPGDNYLTCTNHRAGTFITGVGRIFLGLPNGFNRFGSCDSLDIVIMKKIDMVYPYDYSKFNIPVWKHFDGENTLVRGLSPRINRPFLDIYVGDVRDEIDCLEITEEDINNMD